jgi:hypothetical protein
VTVFVHAVDRSLLVPVQCDTLRRLGSVNDGGYVVPVNALVRASTLLSFGLSTNWSFERAAVELNSLLRVDAYDPSIGRAFMIGLGLRAAVSVPLRLASLSMHGALSSARKVRVSADYFRFFSGARRHHAKRIWYNRDRESASIQDAITRAGLAGNLSVFAKIDVEGTEYRILPSIAHHAELFTGLVVEFHDTDICAERFNTQLRALRATFEVVHVHGNNYGDLSVDGSLPIALEITFLHRALFSRPPAVYCGPLPRPGLDAPNDPRWPDYEIRLATGSA